MRAHPNLRKPYIFTQKGITKMVNDVSHSSLAFSEEVYLLGSGPMAIEHYQKIPNNAYVVAVNRAVGIPFEFEISFKISAWVIADPNAVNSGYYKGYSSRFRGIRIFSMEAARSSSDFGRRDLNKCYSFYQIPRSSRRRTFRVGEIDYQIEGTVGGVGIQILVKKGVERIHLCGFDLSGDVDFKGELPRDHRHGDKWGATVFFDSVISYYQGHGVEIDSISPTKLNKCVQVL